MLNYLLFSSRSYACLIYLLSFMFCLCSSRVEESEKLWDICVFVLLVDVWFSSNSKLYKNIWAEFICVSSLPQRFRFVFFVDSQLHVLTVCRFVKLSTFAPFSCFCVHKTRPNIMMIHLRSTNFTASFPEPFILAMKVLVCLLKTL